MYSIIKVRSNVVFFGRTMVEDTHELDFNIENVWQQVHPSQRFREPYQVPVSSLYLVLRGMELKA